eukprot:TRINITY_DN4992_c0_g1_i1.p2 TRINITY_DN4992_c0_g1~~TRINITY_DN4992_c0_g1_i1.p2  ORF type:complete len:51 (-),score=4.52 TRINITY_DN4992_c0_g1_i1:10-162(-)
MSPMYVISYQVVRTYGLLFLISIFLSKYPKYTAACGGGVGRGWEATVDSM